MTMPDTEQLFRALRSVRLTSVDRESLRHVLATYTQTHRPEPGALAFLMRHALALSALALLLVAGATAVTAHDALPGSPFYPLRTAVEDRVVLAMAPDDARLEAELRLIERALDDEERALDTEPALYEEPSPTPAELKFDDDAEREIRALEEELRDIERDDTPEL